MPLPFLYFPKGSPLPSEIRFYNDTLPIYARSNILSFALYERLFDSVSASDGKIGFLVITFPFEIFPQTHTGK